MRSGGPWRLRGLLVVVWCAAASAAAGSWRQLPGCGGAAQRPYWWRRSPDLGPSGPDLGLRAAVVSSSCPECDSCGTGGSSSDLEVEDGGELLGVWNWSCSCASSVYHVAAAMVLKFCGGGGVNNMGNCLIPVGEKGGVRRYRRKSLPVRAGDDGARGCRSLLGGIAQVCRHRTRSHPGVFDVSGRKPRFGV